MHNPVKKQWNARGSFRPLDGGSFDDEHHFILHGTRAKKDRHPNQKPLRCASSSWPSSRTGGERRCSIRSPGRGESGRLVSTLGSSLVGFRSAIPHGQDRARPLGFQARSAHGAVLVIPRVCGSAGPRKQSDLNWVPARRTASKTNRLRSICRPLPSFSAARCITVGFRPGAIEGPALDLGKAGGRYPERIAGSRARACHTEIHSAGSCPRARPRPLIRSSCPDQQRYRERSSWDPAVLRHGYHLRAKETEAARCQMDLGSRGGPVGIAPRSRISRAPDFAACVRVSTWHTVGWLGRCGPGERAATGVPDRRRSARTSADFGRPRASSRSATRAQCARSPFLR